MADGEPPLHRVRHHVHGVNWRPTRFVDGVPYYHSCGLCNVIPRKTVLLPCSHVLCQSCYRGSITEDDGGDGRGGVCPLDEDPFEVHQCARIRLTATKLNSFRAYCWNQENGCEYVGTLQEVLAHCEEQCTFHTVACPRCRENVLHAELPAHYVAGCGGGSESSAETEESSEPDSEHTYNNTSQTSWSMLKARLSELREERRETTKPSPDDEGFSMEDLTAFLAELEGLDTYSPE